MCSPLFEHRYIDHGDHHANAVPLLFIARGSIKVYSITLSVDIIDGDDSSAILFNGNP